jgi:putative hemolysin
MRYIKEFKMAESKWLSIKESVQSQDIASSQSSLYVTYARNQSEVEEAQRLRYKVFAEEMGADIEGENGLDVDGFDQYCEHLLIRNGTTNQVVGTYRILSPENANEAGGYYSAGEFDICRFQHLYPQLVEVGRACVHRDYRTGGTITLLWAGLAKYMQTHRYEYLMGCASIPMFDGGHMAASLYKRLKEKYLCAPEYRAFPHCPLPMDALNSDLSVECPALIKGYLRLGAQICGEPAWDPHFKTADILIMLPITQINRRYATHFFK